MDTGSVDGVGATDGAAAGAGDIAGAGLATGHTFHNPLFCSRAVFCASTNRS